MGNPVAPLVKNPARDVPRATLGGLAIAALVYVSACAALIRLSAERPPLWRLVARGPAVGSILFCAWVASVSELPLLLWSVAAIGGVILGYLPLAWWRRRAIDRGEPVSLRS